MKTTALLIMGVSGSGKTSLGLALTKELGWAHIEADDFHDDENRGKMAAGFPLDDETRMPWLLRLNVQLLNRQSKGESAVLSCSALKASYREILLDGIEESQIIFLDGDKEAIASRLAQRSSHFMNPRLLASQLESLEPPRKQEALWVDIELSIDAQVKLVLNHLGLNQ